MSSVRARLQAPDEDRERVTVRVPMSMLEELDALVEDDVYKDRSKAIRDGIARVLSEDVDRGDGPVTDGGQCSWVYTSPTNDGGASDTYHTDPDCDRLRRDPHRYRLENIGSKQLCKVCSGDANYAGVGPGGIWELLERADADEVKIR